MIRRQKRWVHFVLHRWTHWKPSKHSKISSLHFRREDFCRMFTTLPRQEKSTLPRLMAGDLEMCTFPTIQANHPEFGKIDHSPPTLSKRTRMVRFEVNSNPERIWNCFACVMNNQTIVVTILSPIDCQRCRVWKEFFKKTMRADMAKIPQMVTPTWKP